MSCIVRRGSILATLFVAFLSVKALADTQSTSTNNPFKQTKPSITLLQTLSRAAPHANPKVINLALTALECATLHGMNPSRSLTVIDYSLPSTTPRLWVFDLKLGKLLFEELVAHGKNTGENYAQAFSNTYGSLQSSLGLFLTKETYNGSNGYSLRMDGLEEGFNDNAMERAIVFHGADYVNTRFVKKQGRIGRSFGCPAVRTGIAKKVIDTIKGEQFLFSYYPDQHWLADSQFLNCSASQHLASKD